jgi:glucokinase
MANQVIEEVVIHLAMVIINIAAILDPERIILDGSVGRALEPYTDRILERVKGRLPQIPELRYSRLGPNATVTGAIAAGLALEREADARRVLGDLPARGAPVVSLPAYGELAHD